MNQLFIQHSIGFPLLPLYAGKRAGVERRRLEPAVVVLGLCLLLLVGCGKKADYATWQGTVERHVNEIGGGDPSALRDVTLADGRPGFAIFSNDRPDQSTDAVGVLLGHPEVNGRLWVVYLFGLVKRQEVQDMRLAAMEIQENGEYRWVSGTPDRKALDTYRAYNEQLAERRFPYRTAPPAEYRSFPLVSDRFELTVEGSTLRAVHYPSAATWQLALP